MIWSAYITAHIFFGCLVGYSQLNANPNQVIFCTFKEGWQGFESMSSDGHGFIYPITVELGIH
jgi:hypothetical protein